jgi:hypothetical protein
VTAERRDAPAPEDFAVALLQAGEALSDAATQVGATDLGGVVFGTAAPGVLGELGRHLHGQWSSALRVRESEARDQADRMVDLAGRLRRATETYVDTDLAGSVRITDAERGAP